MAGPLAGWRHLLKNHHALLYMECHTSGCHTVHLINWQEATENTQLPRIFCSLCKMIANMSVSDKALHLVHATEFSTFFSQSVGLLRHKSSGLQADFISRLCWDSHSRFPNQIICLCTVCCCWYPKQEAKNNSNSIKLKIKRVKWDVHIGTST